MDDFESMVRMRNRLAAFSNNLTNTFLDDMIFDYSQTVAGGGEYLYWDEGMDSSGPDSPSSSSSETSTTTTTSITSTSEEPTSISESDPESEDITITDSDPDSEATEASTLSPISIPDTEPAAAHVSGSAVVPASIHDQIMDQEEQPQDLSTNSENRNQQNSNNKRSMSPIESENAKRRNIGEIVDKLSAKQTKANVYCSTPKTITKAKPKVLHPFEAMINKRIKADALARKNVKKLDIQGIKININAYVKKLLHSVIDENAESAICLPSPAVARWLNGDKKSDLAEKVIELYEKMEFASDHSKDLFSQEKMESFPIEYEYNPNKSRQRRSYDDQIVRQVRAKNNLASRHSRIKKKMCQQFIKWDVEYYQEENRGFYTQEYFMNHTLKKLEGTVANINLIMRLRIDCGLK